MARPVSSESPSVKSRIGSVELQRPPSSGRLSAASRGMTETTQSARHKPTTPAITLTSVLSKTNSLTTP